MAPPSARGGRVTWCTLDRGHTTVTVGSGVQRPTPRRLPTDTFRLLSRNLLGFILCGADSTKVGGANTKATAFGSVVKVKGQKQAQPISGGALA